MATPAFHLLIPLVLGFLDRSYSPMWQYLSELAAPKHPLAFVVSACFVVTGLLLIAFAAGLYFGLPRSLFSLILFLLLGLTGLVNVGAGFFPVHPRGLVGQVHTVVSQAGLTGGVVAPLFFWLAIPQQPQWHPLALFTLVRQAPVVVMFALYSYVTETRRRPSSRAVIGLFQKIYLGVF